MSNSEETTKSGVGPLIKRHTQRQRALIISFIVFVLSFALFIYTMPEDPDADPNTISMLFFIIVFLSGLTFNISLWLCARSTESSAIIWVGLNILLGPFSTIFIVFMMNSKISKTISDLKVTRDSYA